MKTITLLLICGLFITGCSSKKIRSEGERIYRTGRNSEGNVLLDKRLSSITFIKSCQGCHGKTGTRINSCDIRWSHLSDPDRISVPYTDSLFYRFLDKDVKSNGEAAQTGVHWNMSSIEKAALLEYLKTL